ncbi:SDR family NAD(P)-dependent oxidoreductase [Oceanomicrobium pacificus]|uniref:SDR family NAD(P)-dependent oxidoreductase n=1 Tax=Oceanomicrobium pacificus TaxID=2692916 RepID=A0A6B0TXX2_9RHOB|nr:SDR family NAD(P)-dependent oxidoreductase [Oceanomicrobium pacificus]MXU66142.1 SDR family NAD(P)-dependent oxidoreductase [Oceanomicrobium pacificus]
MNLSDIGSAIVTGGASGLGRATATALADAGVRIALLDRDADRGTAAARDLGALFVETDVTDPASVASGLAAASAANGPARLCVNCAGIAPGAKTIDRDGAAHDPALFARAVSVNLTGTFNMATQAAAAMAMLDPVGADGERGLIVNTASIAAYEGQIGQIAYAASKGGVAAMTLPMARDLARSGIRVMAVAPGLFLTPMLEGLPEEVQTSLGAQVPYPPRLGKPSEFAALVLHMVENPMMNGEVIRLDGAIRLAPK